MNYKILIVMAISSVCFRTAYAADQGASNTTSGGGSSAPIFLGQGISQTPARNTGPAPIASLSQTPSKTGKNLFEQQMNESTAKMSAKINAGADARKAAVMQHQKERIAALEKKWEEEDKAKNGQKKGTGSDEPPVQKREAIVMPPTSSGDIRGDGRPPRVFNVQ